jgi:1-acyl-sn-glycerol-3-phosphate acyltransferase
LKKFIARFWFTLAGWKLDVTKENLDRLRHSVMLASPHTSNWDFIYALFGFWLMGVDLKYFIKDDYTKGILGGLFKWTGAIGVDRGKRNNLVEHTINLLKENDELVILVPAEGTRKWVPKWKKGFYNIALGAEVPVSFGYLDYKHKIAGVGDVYSLTGDFEKDMDHIQAFYANINPKHPELYNPKIY